MLRWPWRRPDPYFFFSDRELQAIAARGAEYQSAEPFPHAVIDDFLPRWVADKLLAEFPLARQLPFAESAGENRQGKRFSREEVRIAPEFNRAVIFTTNDRTPHGFPEPLCCPEGETRKSLQLYYYTAGRPPSEQSAPHGTLFQVRSS